MVGNTSLRLPRLVHHANSEEWPGVLWGLVAKLEFCLARSNSARAACELTTQRQGPQPGRKEQDQAYSPAAAFGRCRCITRRRKRGDPGTKCIDKGPRQTVSLDSHKPALEPCSFEFPGRQPGITSGLGERPMNAALERQGRGPQQSEGDGHRAATGPRVAEREGRDWETGRGGVMVDAHCPCAARNPVWQTVRPLHRGLS